MVGIIQSGPELPSSGADWPGWMFGVLLCNDLHACDRSPVSTVFLTWHKCLQLVQWPGYVCWPIVTNLRPITVTHAWARPAWLLNTKPQTFESPMLLLIWMSVRRFVPWTLGPLGAWFINRSNELPTWHFPTDQLRFGRCANCMLSSRMLCTRHGWHPKLLPASALRVHASRQLKPVNELIVPMRRRAPFSMPLQWQRLLGMTLEATSFSLWTSFGWTDQQLVLSGMGRYPIKEHLAVGHFLPMATPNESFFGLGAQRHHMPGPCDLAWNRSEIVGSSRTWRRVSCRQCKGTPSFSCGWHGDQWWLGPQSHLVSFLAILSSLDW